MNLPALLAAAEFWHWWIFGVALIVIETFAPGTVFLWMGVSAGLVGLVLAVAPGLAWETQWLLFAALSVIAVGAWRAWQRKHPTETDLPTLNRRGEQYVGRSFTLSEPIVNGFGKIKVDDTIWKIEGDDMPEGSRVTVTGVSGTILRVEKG